MGEHELCKLGVRGSNPLASTTRRAPPSGACSWQATCRVVEGETRACPERGRREAAESKGV